MYFYVLVSCCSFMYIIYRCSNLLSYDANLSIYNSPHLIYDMNFLSENEEQSDADKSASESEGEEQSDTSANAGGEHSD